MDTVVVSRLLLSKKEDEASAAQRLLAESAARTRDERDAAIGVLIAALQRDEQRTKTRATVLGSAVGLSVLGLYVAGVFFSMRPHGVNVVLFFLFITKWRPLQWCRGRCSSLRARVALALAEHGDLRALGPLVEAFAANRPEAPRPVVARALDALLPRFQPGAAAFLNPRQRDTLNTFLTNWTPEQKHIAPLDNIRSMIKLLRVAALAGDKETVPALTALIAKEGKYGNLMPVIEAARESLAALNARFDGWVAPATTAGLGRYRYRP